MAHGDSLRETGFQGCTTPCQQALTQMCFLVAAGIYPAHVRGVLIMNALILLTMLVNTPTVLILVNHVNENPCEEAHSFFYGPNEK